MPSIKISYDAKWGGGDSVALPISKSLALRALTLDAVSQRLGHGGMQDCRIPLSEDLEGMMRALSLYFSSEGEKGGCVNIGAGGAPFRFFTALAASTPDINLMIDSDPALKRRPNSMLIDALNTAGADITTLENAGTPPIRIHGRQILPDRVEVDCGVSSQFLSALIMAAPLWENGLDVEYDPSKIVSLPYLEMTIRMMRLFSCNVDISEGRLRVAPGKCTAPNRYAVEADWSAASYFYEYALLLPGKEILIKHLTPSNKSMQGDSACEVIFGRLGVSTSYREDGSAALKCDGEALDRWKKNNEVYVLNLNGTPDLVPALAVAFCCAGVRFRFEGVAHLRHKETDRMGALVAELAKLGYLLSPESDALSWLGQRCKAEKIPEISTYSDHRMAMAMAPAAIVHGPLIIRSPEVVRKSFPDYWQNLKELGIRN